MSFNAEIFANWLNNAFQNSKFKSQAELAAKINVSRQYLNRLMRAKPQDVGHPPSLPSRQIILDLCAALGVKNDEALAIAGYAPSNADDIPKPIFDAIARAGSIGEEDARFIADMIDSISKRNRK